LTLLGTRQLFVCADGGSSRVAQRSVGTRDEARWPKRSLTLLSSAAQARGCVDARVQQGCAPWLPVYKGMLRLRPAGEGCEALSSNSGPRPLLSPPVNTPLALPPAAAKNSSGCKAPQPAFCHCSMLQALRLLLAEPLTFTLLLPCPHLQLRLHSCQIRTQAKSQRARWNGLQVAGGC
jgi:hypothetical protein